IKTREPPLVCARGIRVPSEKSQTTSDPKAHSWDADYDLRALRALADYNRLTSGLCAIVVISLSATAISAFSHRHADTRERSTGIPGGAINSATIEARDCFRFSDLRGGAAYAVR